jgi:acetyl-CoA C-acetyltransferase/acetyl-CoA acyltransferase
MRKVAIVGVGQTIFTAAQEKTAVELFAEAAMDALNESNLEPRDVQALFLGNVYGDFSEGQTNIQAFCADNIGALNIPATRYETVCASASAATRDAFIWVASGFYDIVLAGGTETAAKMGTAMATRTFAMGSDAHYEYPSGITFPAFFALLAHLYAAKYDIPLARLKEQMATVSVQSYRYGALNPKAQLRKEVTTEDVLKSTMVCSPLQLHDCCPFSDGAAAIVLASEEKARELTAKPVFITGIGQASQGPLANEEDYLPHLRARELAAKHAYDMAGLAPKDIDICELHDCFSIAAIIAAESLGFFEKGTAGEAWAKGEADIGGRVAINLSGGLKTKGHPIGATGAGQVYEITRQFRGEVEPERLAEGVKIGITDTLGGDGGTVCNLILEKGW